MRSALRVAHFPAWYQDGEDTVVQRPLEGLSSAGMPEQESRHAFCTNGGGGAIAEQLTTEKAEE